MTILTIFQMKKSSRYLEIKPPEFLTCIVAGFIKIFVIFCSIPFFHYLFISLKHLNIKSVFIYLLTSLDFSFKIIGFKCYIKTKQIYFYKFFPWKIMKTNQICIYFILWIFLDKYFCFYVSNPRTLNLKFFFLCI